MNVTRTIVDYRYTIVLDHSEALTLQHFIGDHNEDAMKEHLHETDDWTFISSLFDQLYNLIEREDC